MSATQPSTPDSRTTQIASATCDNCQESGFKCSGSCPCQECTLRDITCIFDEVKPRNTHFNSASSSGAQSCEEPEGSPLARASRSGIDEQAGTRLERDEMHDRSSSANPNASSFADEPLFHVTASPWTDVTDDNDSVSHLISVYFTWIHYAYPSVDQDLFVREMQTGSLSSQFCSQLLVNSMLAVACSHTDHPSAFADPSDPSTRALHFLDESARLWALERGNVNLANLQAIPILIMATVACGRDRPAILYASESITLAYELTVAVKKRQRHEVGEFDTPEFRRSHALAAWAAFLVQTEVAICWSRPLELQVPFRKSPYTAEDSKLIDTWVPYPKSSPAILYYPFILMAERFRLYEVASKLRPLVLSGDPQDSPLPGYIILDRATKVDRLCCIQEDLRVWYSALPPEARIEVTSEPILTEPLADLHLAYHSFRINTASHLLRVDGLAQQEQDDAGGQIIDASRNIADILQRRIGTIGLSYFGVYTGQASSLSAYALLDHLQEPGIPDTFHTVMIGLANTARRWPLPRGIIKMISIELQKRKLDQFVHKVTLDSMRLSAAESWTYRDQAILEQTIYPNYAAIKEQGNALSEMGDLLEEYARLHLSNGKEDASGG